MKSYAVVAAGILLLCGAYTARGQDKFYNYYEKGVEYVEKADWLRAIQEFQSATSLEFEDARRKRTYGTHFMEYFPHREIGIAYYNLGESGNALKELTLSLDYVDSRRAENYLDLVKKGIPVSALEEMKRKAAEEKARLAREKEEQEQREAAEAKGKEKEQVESAKQVPLPVGALTYDPSKVTQVGSRLALAVLPFTGKGAAADFAPNATDKMVTQLVNLRRFKVIEREAIDKIMSEHSFQASGVVDEATAVQLGKVAGADAIVLCNITMVSGNAKLSARVIDTETSEAIVAKTQTADGSDWSDIEHGVEQLGIAIYNELPLVEGYVIRADGDDMYIDAGSAKGIRKGSKCVAFREGDNIVHPKTGEVLGKKFTKLGELVVVQVQEKVSEVRIVEKDQTIKVGDKIVVK
jgi:TolB-like protein